MGVVPTRHSAVRHLRTTQHTDTQQIDLGITGGDSDFVITITITITTSIKFAGVYLSVRQ